MRAHLLAAHLCLALVVAACAPSVPPAGPGPETVTATAADGVAVVGEVYTGGLPATAPLVVLFLLLAASASAQEGIYMQVPQEAPPVTGPFVAVRVHADGSATLDGAVSDSSEVATAIRSHIRAHPDGGVAFSASRDAPYSRYIHFLEAIKEVYSTERDAVAVREFGEPYADLSDAEQEAVREFIPIRISLAEPE